MDDRRTCASAANARRNTRFAGEWTQIQVVLLGAKNFNRAVMAKNIVYFDLETQRSADEVGGWNNISKMGMSIGVTFSAASGEYKIYHEKAVDQLIRELQRADLVI